MWRDDGDLHEIAGSLVRAARVLARLDGTTAARVLFCSRALLEELGMHERFFVDANEKAFAELRAQLDADVLTEEQERGERLSIEEGIELALTALRKASASVRPDD